MMASSVHKFQFALKTCDLHEHKELTTCCKTCKRSICSSCLKSDHITHDWDLISELVKEKKIQLPEECRKIQSDDLTALERRIKEYDSLLKKVERQYTENENTLNGIRKTLVSYVNRVIDEDIDRCKERQMESKQIIDREREELKKKLVYLRKMTTALDKEVTSLPDHDILEMEQEMMAALEIAKSEITKKHFYTAKFVSGEMDLDIIRKIIGDIEIVTLEEAKSFQPYSKAICRLEPTSDTTAWVREKDNMNVCLVNINGEILRRLTAPCDDLTVIRDDNMIALTQSTRNVIKITNEKEEMTSIDTKPLMPTFISTTDNGDLFVTLIDDDDFYNLLPTSRRIVRRMTLKGKVLHTYEFREDGKTRLFTLPKRATENKNTDVCVINRTSTKCGELIVLHGDGRVKLTYLGEGVSPPFNPTDVQCDSKCRILINDLNYTSIYILNNEGRLISRVSSSIQENPRTISLQGNKLWIGCNNGVVKMYNYSM